jgi:exopolyphosphatase/guanosine-5'-triphosphate,3'-diphosphate pyrophosphatase
MAVLDLGSTTFQLLVADVDADGSLTPILRDRVVLNLAQVLADRGHIPRKVAVRAADTARRLRDIAVRAGSEQLMPIATSALRDSPNRDELATTLEEAVGMPVGFIDGQEEARLTLLGISWSVALDGASTLLLDLGGGSLEVALADRTGLVWGRSLPIGAGRLTGLLAGSNPPTKEERKRVRAAVRDAVAPLVRDVKAATPQHCVASGGTAGALARLLAAKHWTSPPASLNQYSVSVTELRGVTRRLASLSLEARLRIKGVDERRADLLPVGGWILTTAAEALGVKEMVHSEWGFREGAILDALGFAQVSVPEPLDLRRRSVDHLVRLWGSSPRHLDQVARIAEALFDGLHPQHRLGDKDRELLGHGARLHDVGSQISPAQFHKHGAYLVEHGGLRGFSPHEIAIIASLVRFQRGKDPRSTYPPFGELPADLRRRCVVLIGIVRIARAIARGPEDENLSVDVKTRGGRSAIIVGGASNPQAVVAEANEARDLLARTLGISVRIGATGGTGGSPGAVSRK